MNVTPEEKISGVSLHQGNEVTKNAFDTVWFCGFWFKIEVKKSGWTSFILSYSERSG